MISRPFPKALPHGPVRQLFPDIFFVTGTIAMAGPLRFSRNMTVIRQGRELVLVNSVRLSEQGLQELSELGKIAHVIRLAGFHGADDAFYKHDCGAKIWAIQGQRYTTGFKQTNEIYFQADAEIDESTSLPIEGASVYLFSSRPPEAILHLNQEGGVLITGDSLQNWAQTDEYFSWLGGAMMRVMGFIKPHNVGPGWLKQAKPPAKDLRGLLDLNFEHVLPSHGSPTIGSAKNAYRSAIEAAAALREK